MPNIKVLGRRPEPLLLEFQCRQTEGSTPEEVCLEVLNLPMGGNLILSRRRCEASPVLWFFGKAAGNVQARILNAEGPIQVAEQGFPLFYSGMG